MMGYDEDEDFGEDVEINDKQLKQLVHDPAMAALTAMPLDGNEDLAGIAMTQEQMQLRHEQMAAMANYEMQQ